MSDTTYRVRVTRRVQFHLEGSQAWADRHETEPHPDPTEEAHRNLNRKLEAARSTRADGSVLLELTEAEAYALEGYAGAMAVGAADNAGPYDPDATADLNAARACLRQLRKLGVEWRPGR